MRIYDTADQSGAVFRSVPVGCFQFPKALSVGTSPFCPNCWIVYEPFELLTMYQVPSDGRNTPMSALPSPSKSPGVGISAAKPNTYGTYVVVALRLTYQSPSDGR